MVLPDTPAAAALAERLMTPKVGCITHASGRPWLLRPWRAAEVVSAQAGEARVAVLGRCLLTDQDLAARVAHVRDVRQVEKAVGTVAGSYHLLATVGGRVWARGVASAACRIFTTRVDGVPVAASGADIVAGLAGGALDWDMVAARLMDPPWTTTSWGGRTMWQGIEAVRPDEALLWDRDGTQRTVRWWQPPEPELSLPKAADAVRKALVEAVATCTAGGGTISSDLSGGLDSTSLCFLAARGGTAELVTLRWEGVDARNDDSHWAKRATASLPGATHLLVGADETPDWFTGVGSMRLATDEPAPWARDVAKQSDVLRRVREHGSRLHLSGGGGDELFTPSLPYLADLMWSHPLHVLRQVRRRCLDLRVSPAAGLWTLARRSDYQRWLRRAARDVTGEPVIESLTEQFGWQLPPRLPPWASPQAVHAARAVLDEAAERRPQPLAPRRWQHNILHQVREGGNTVRQMNLALPEPDYAYPYTDDAVVTAALSLRPEEADLPGSFKPLLTSAMNGLVPPEVLCRKTKGYYDADFHGALRRQRSEYLSLLDGSLLAKAGLIDPDRVRRAMHSHAAVSDTRLLLPTVACEVWLRSHVQAPTAPIRAGNGR
ncbi:asparagine synthase-related protein [Streptomyces chrestomyceticus]|uniref:asparagine synthase-related protein n=1 Tax=Streptomyces chrestomyceticus TaxID=68185 RepID=UPI0035A9872C